PPDSPLPGALDNVHRGVRGLELRRGGEVARYSPTWMLATNRSFARVLELFAEARDLEDLAGVEASVFDAEQFLVLLGDGGVRARRLFRGNETVRAEDVDAASVAATARRLGDWLARAVHPDGRMTYQWFPSRGEESQGDNTVRQWMATAALGRYAAWRDDERVWALTRRNVARNLDAYYTEQLGLGLIEEGPDKVKLGAVALAGRALAEHPDRPRLAPVIDALEATTVHLAEPDGSFRTWFRPADRDDQHNFYPGEALYFWAHRYAERRDPATLERLMRAFRFYRGWHLDPANRNPAFVPWHTQAYVETWRHTRSDELATFVFEMNDWLLDMQQWDSAPYPDLRGRFYDPDRPGYGPPHASATGVYLEGLADAFWLAREVGDDGRAERYRVALVRGIRSVMQLEFADDADLYYVSDRARVRGGVRTEAYDNRIRVDNVQHNLMALLKVLERFGPADYRPS
ncbi:MAG TPA: hypothetical protein VNU01_11060, partial [Egibacteraceae bacterium]|nr:hypothetical protein [Egibacteraceae bacterium]